MTDDACVRFLQECLPRIGLQWRGYRKVRGMVCKRVRRRMRELSLAGYDDYRAYLEATLTEWDRLAAFCRIPISRFYRDKEVFNVLGREVLPSLAEEARKREGAAVSVWSVGCASGEEPYSVAILWALDVVPNFPDMSLRVLATDAEPHMIARAKRGCYKQGSLKDVPSSWVARAFFLEQNECCVRDPLREVVTFKTADFMRNPPNERFDLILCRNVAFTYFALAEQQEAQRILTRHLRREGLLVLGAHEKLPGPAKEFRAIDNLPIYERKDDPGGARGPF